MTSLAFLPVSSRSRGSPTSSGGGGAPARMTSSRAYRRRHGVAVFVVVSSLVLMLTSSALLVDASSVSAVADASNAAANALTSGLQQKRHLRATAAANNYRVGRSLEDATEALEAAEEAEEEEEEEGEEEEAPEDETASDNPFGQEETKNEEDEEEHDEDGRDPIPEDEDLTSEEAAAAEELTGEGTGDDIDEVVEEEEEEEGEDESAPADELEDEVPEDASEEEDAEEEESPAKGTTEGTGGDDEDEDEDTATTTEEEEEEEEGPIDEEILDELVNEEGELPEDVVEEINEEIEGILDAVAEATSGEPTMIDTTEGDEGGEDAFDEDTEQWTPVGAPTVDQEEVQAPTVDYFDFKQTPEPTKPYSPPDEDYDPLDGVDAEETLGYEEEESGSYGSTSKEPVESPFDDGSWQDEAYKQAYDWLNGGDGEENMASVARDQRVKVAVGVLLGLGITLALITASCALNKPDGLCAGCCRLMLKLISCICHILCLPCRMCCGSKRAEDRQGATLVGRSDLEFS